MQEFKENVKKFKESEIYRSVGLVFIEVLKFEKRFNFVRVKFKF